MDKNRRHDLLSDYIENTLSPGDRAAMEAELRTNPEARAELESLRGVWRGLDQLASAPIEEPPMFFRDNIMSVIERNGTRRGYWPGERAATANLPFWQRLFPNYGRLAVGAAFGAAFVATVFLVFHTNEGAPVSVKAGTGVPIASVANGLVLPYQGQVVESDAVEGAPRLVITTGRTLTPDATHACDFTFWLENAPQGSARFTVLNSEIASVGSEPPTYRFRGLTATTAQTLRIPFDPAKTSAMELQVHWSAEGTPHDRYLFVPTTATAAASANEAAATNTPPVAFTLAEMTLLDALKEVSAHTGVPIALEDVKGADTMRVALAADGKESISVMLRRGLGPLGLHVSRSPSGVLVTPMP